MRRLTPFLILLLLGTITACSDESPQPSTAQNHTAPDRPAPAAPVTADVDGARIIAADAEAGNWMTHGRTYDEQRFSPLSQINEDNVAELGLAWYKGLDTKLGLEPTPLVVDGVMFTTSVFNLIIALDAATGTEIWRYDPKVRRDWMRYVCCGNVNRGVAVWKGKVYEATLDGRLVAVDAATGKLAWDTLTIDPDQPYSITGAPRVVKGKVIIGNGGAELGVRGYVSAYDAESGDLVWRFHTIPGNPADGFESPAMEMAAATWTGEWWKYGGGGTAWDSFAFDPELNLLYIGTGNGGPWAQEIRSPGGGDNLFLASIVAVDADTGEYVWHYQTTPGDEWDFTATQPMILADLNIGGEIRKVLMQAPKNGFFYVLDRTNGELISAQNIVPVNWASSVDPATGRPVMVEENRYTDRAVLITPGPNGAHDWQSMSWHPGTGLVYIPIHEMSWGYSYDPNFTFRKFNWNIGANPNAADPPGIENAVSTGALLAWDPLRQQPAWRVDLGGPWNGGVLSTAGNLVVEGAADGRFVIYRADNGDILWQMPIQTGAIAAPISYQVNGEQYIAIAAGWGGAMVLMGNHLGPIHRGESRILAFKLGGAVQLPPLPDAAPVPPPPPSNASEETVTRGLGLYMAHCGNCHGFFAISGGTIPDLRHMTPETHAQFRDIVFGGTRLDLGMPPFGDRLSDEELEAIHAYVIRRANEDWEG